MGFKFIHTGDWQIGRPFAAFGSDKPAVLRQARLDVIGTIATLAIERSVKHILVAGDIFDSVTLPDAQIRSVFEKLGSYRDVTWHLLPGNHDFAARGGFWHRAAKLASTDNIIIHDEPKPYEAEPGLFVLPAPLKGRTAEVDPTEWMDKAETPKNTIRIGLAHGAIQGFGSSGDASVLISPSRVKRATLDYLALGDWHGMAKVSDRVWYSGTPEPDRFPNNDPGYALVVEVGGGAPQVEPVRTARFTWTSKSLELHGPQSVATFVEDIRSAGPQLDRMLVRLDISGAVSVGEWSEIEASLQDLEPALFHFEWRDADLHFLMGDADLEAMGSGALRNVAQRLSEQAQTTDPQQRAIAETALRHLYRFVRRAEGQL